VRADCQSHERSTRRRLGLAIYSCFLKKERNFSFAGHGEILAGGWLLMRATYCGVTVTRTALGLDRIAGGNTGEATEGVQETVH
jgi:hypothetical protein